MLIRFLVSFLIMAATFVANAHKTDELNLKEAQHCIKLLRYYEAKYKIPHNLLYSIALNESGRFHKQFKISIPWPWTVNVNGSGHYFDNKSQAVKFVKQKLREGIKSMDVGCMQINLKHHPKAFYSVEHAFDPKANINYGASLLRSKYDSLGYWNEAIGRYHSSNKVLSKKYYYKIIQLTKNINQHKLPSKREIRSVFVQQKTYNSPLLK